MAYPNLYSDETVVLNAQNVKVKSVSFEAVLTTRRLILVDSKKHLIAPQEILLATIRDIEPGENAIRDSTLTLSIITQTGATRQMILTFSKTSGGDRRRECDEWVKLLRQSISTAVQHAIMPDHQPPAEPQDVSAGYSHASVNVDVTNVPSASPAKKKIEVARPGPIKKIVEAPPSMPKPVETTSLPSGSFCNRCGNRVPEGSAFCNKCGTPVVTESDIEAHLAAAASALTAPPVSTVPQVNITTPPVYGAGTDRKDRPIEDVIHSIEPLIEDSVPRTYPYPLVPKQVYQPHAADASNEPAPDAPAEAEAAAAPQGAETPAIPEVSWPVLGSAAGTSTPAPSGAADAPAGYPAPPVPSGAKKSRKGIAIGIIAVVVIAIIAAVFIFVNPLGGGQASEVTPAPTPEATTMATEVPTAVATTKVTVAATTAEPAATAAAAASGGQLVVPEQGVWVHILYANGYTGSYGTPGRETTISGEGERLFQIPTSEGIVVANIQKADGSSDKLIVTVYKNGVVVQEKSTITPKGIVEIQADLKPSPTPTPTPTQTKVPIPVKTTAAAANETANETVTATTTA